MQPLLSVDHGVAGGASYLTRVGASRSETFNPAATATEMAIGGATGALGAGAGAAGKAVVGKMIASSAAKGVTSTEQALANASKLSESGQGVVPRKWIYSNRVLRRMESEPGPFHNFPPSFDDEILSKGPRMVDRGKLADKPRENMSEDSVQYRLPGEINGHRGTFEIYTRPSTSGRTEVINASLLQSRKRCDLMAKNDWMSDFFYELVEDHSGTSQYSFFADGSGPRCARIFVHPHGRESWVADFFGPECPGVNVASEIVGTPHPAGLCIVERGVAFLGDVRKPESFETLDLIGPVVTVNADIDEGVLFLSSPWEILAIGYQGVRWVSPRLAIDGLRIVDVRGGWLRGVFDPGEFEEREFSINLRTGIL